MWENGILRFEVMVKVRDGSMRMGSGNMGEVGDENVEGTKFGSKEQVTDWNMGELRHRSVG
jgi:hypothetical protein